MGAGTIEFSLNGVSRYENIIDALGIDQMQAFAEGLVDYSAASIQRVSFTQLLNVSLTSAVDDLKSLKSVGKVRLKVVEDFRDEWVYIPAPNLEHFPLNIDGEYQMTDTAGTAIAALYQAVTGIAVEFDEGYVTG